MRLDTLLDLDSALTTALQYEDTAKWMTGDTLLAAIDAGLHTQLGGIRKLEEYAAQTTGRGWRTMHRRRVVSATFAPETRCDGVAWETHTRIAELVRGDVPQALAWLAVAADDQMTADQVEAALKATDGNATRGERVYLLRAARATVVMVEGRRVVFELDRECDMQPGQVVTLTVAIDMQETAQERANV